MSDEPPNGWVSAANRCSVAAERLRLYAPVYRLLGFYNIAECDEAVADLLDRDAAAYRAKAAAP